MIDHFIGVSEAKPLSSGWCETGSFGVLRLCNHFWYITVAQSFLVRRGCAIVFGTSRNRFWYVVVVQSFLVHRSYTIGFGVSRLHNSLPDMVHT